MTRTLAIVALLLLAAAPAAAQKLEKILKYTKPSLPAYFTAVTK